MIWGYLFLALMAAGVVWGIKSFLDKEDLRMETDEDRQKLADEANRALSKRPPL